MIVPDEEDIIFINSAKKYNSSAGQCLLGISFTQPNQEEYKKKFEERLLQHNYRFKELSAKDPLLKILLWLFDLFIWLIDCFYYLFLNINTLKSWSAVSFTFTRSFWDSWLSFRLTRARSLLCNSGLHKRRYKSQYLLLFSSRSPRGYVQICALLASLFIRISKAPYIPHSLYDKYNPKSHTADRELSKHRYFLESISIFIHLVQAHTWIPNQRTPVNKGFQKFSILILRPSHAQDKYNIIWDFGFPYQSWEGHLCVWCFLVLANIFLYQGQSHDYLRWRFCACMVVFWENSWIFKVQICANIL